METKNEGRKYAVIAGVCCICTALYYLRVFLIAERDQLYIDYAYYRLFYSITLIVFGIMLIVAKRGIPLIAASGAFIIADRLWDLTYSFSYFSFFYFVAEALLFCIIIVNCIPSMNKYAVRFRLFWFVPGVIIVLDYLMPMIIYNYYSSSTLICCILEAAIFLFVGLWLKETLVEKPNNNTIEAA